MSSFSTTTSSYSTSGTSSTSSYAGGSTITTSSGYTSSGSSSVSSSSISSGWFSSSSSSFTGNIFSSSSSFTGNIFSSSSSGNSSGNLFGSSNDFSDGSSSIGGFCYDWVTYRGFTIYDPLLIPLCMWALYIGISKHRLFKKYNDTYIYSITFLMYGIMMTCALLADSLSNNFSEVLKFIVGIADVDLTSTVGTFFLYCGLSDLNIINPKSFKTQLVMVFNSLILLISWVYANHYAPANTAGLLNLGLYEGVVGISCGAYLVIQIIYLCRNNRLKQILWLIAGGVVGGIGLGITLYTHKWCEYFGGRFSSSYAWFFLSDVAMLLIAKYVISSRGNDELINAYGKCWNEDSCNQDDEQGDIESNIKYQPVVFIQQPIVLQQQQQQQQSNGYILLHTQQSQQQQQFYFK